MGNNVVCCEKRDVSYELKTPNGPKPLLEQPVDTAKDAKVLKTAQGRKDVVALAELLGSVEPFQEANVHNRWATYPVVVGAYAALYLSRLFADRGYLTEPRNRDAILQSRCVENLKANLAADNRDVKEMSLIALSFLANAHSKDRMMSNRVREDDGLSAIASLLDDEKEAVRHLTANLLRSLYFQWPIVEKEMLELGIVEQMARMLPKYTVAEFIKDGLLNLSDFIYDVRGRLLQRNLLPLVENGLADVLAETEDRLAVVCRLDDEWEVYSSEIHNTLRELQAQVAQVASRAAARATV